MAFPERSVRAHSSERTHAVARACSRRRCRTATGIRIGIAIALSGGHFASVLAQEDLDSLLEGGSAPPPKESDSPEPAKSPAPDQGAAADTTSADTRAPAATESEASEPGTPAAPASEPAPASQRRARRTIEEIIVTAQKTEQGLREVPISISVVDDAFLRQEGISDLQALSAYVPNTTLNINPFLPDIRIRGFGSEGLNKGFEQSVGLVLDGVPYGRQQYFQSALFDIERVEILRGPQGTLFGRNTSAGVFNITTKNPSDDFTGSIGLGYGELDRRKIEAAVGGPAIPGILNFRIAGLLDESDGYVRNTTADVFPESQPLLGGREHRALRLKIGAPNLLGAAVVLGYERVDLELIGATTELGIVPDELVPFYEEWDPNFDRISGNYVGSLNHPTGTDMTADTLTLGGNYDVGPWRVDAVAGHAMLDVVESADLDLGPSPMFWADPRKDDNTQTTLELRLASPILPGALGLANIFGLGLGTSDVTLGFFWQRRDMDDSLEVDGLDNAVIAEFLAAQAPGPGVLPPIQGAGPGVEISTLFFEQSSNAIAGFGQTNWRFIDRWNLQLGLRFSREEKEGHWQRVFDTGPNPFMSVALAFEEFTADLERTDTFVTPKVTLQHDWSDDVGFFASWGTGFKAGGYNAWLTASDNPDRLQFEPEEVSSWEAGSKMRLLDGAATANLAVFWMNLEDFQEITASPNDLEQFVENAAEARARGVEADLAWLPTDWLSLRAAVGFNDGKFLDFPIGGCPPDRENTDGDDDPRCDLSGEPLFRTPKWTATVTPSVSYPVDGIPGIGGVLATVAGIDLMAGLNVEYQSSKFVARFRDPRVVQPAFVRLDGFFGFRNAGQGWSASLIGKNLTDEVVLARRDDVVLSAQVSGEGAFWQFVEPPRLFFGEFRWEF